MWRVDTPKRVAKSITKLNHTDQDTIIKFLEVTLPAMKNPRSKGEPLHGVLKGYWKYVIGDYRIIADILDKEIVIVIVEVGHRKEVYKLLQRND